jgi:hypothetical protein
LHHCNSLEKGMIAELLSHQMNFWFNLAARLTPAPVWLSHSQSQGLVSLHWARPEKKPPMKCPAQYEGIWNLSEIKEMWMAFWLMAINLDCALSSWAARKGGLSLKPFPDWSHLHPSVVILKSSYVPDLIVWHQPRKKVHKTGPTLCH